MTLYIINAIVMHRIAGKNPKALSLVEISNHMSRFAFYYWCPT